MNRYVTLAVCQTGVGLALCNDRRWPETYRMLCFNGAQVVLTG